MPFRETEFPDLRVFEPAIFKDERGYFYESFNQRVFTEAGINESFVQDNQSFSRKGTLRGLHYQLDPFAQAKLVRVIQGEVLDVVVDLRKGSPTFGKYLSIRLSGENHTQLYIPRGFAHGYAVLSETALFFYKCDSLYNKQAERGILYNDPELNIDWQTDMNTAIISEKDKLNSLFRNAEMNFVFHG
jgi:dTDP-4-dehydrorhamnose 3,5-epimerase